MTREELEKAEDALIAASFALNRLIKAAHEDGNEDLWATIWVNALVLRDRVHELLAKTGT